MVWVGQSARLLELVNLPSFVELVELVKHFRFSGNRGTLNRLAGRAAGFAIPVAMVSAGAMDW
jgi:hypothetical protein